MQWCGSSVLTRQERAVHGVVTCVCTYVPVFSCSSHPPSHLFASCKDKKAKRKIARCTCASTADGFPNACRVLKQWARRKTSHCWQVCSVGGWLTARKYVSPSAGPLLTTTCVVLRVVQLSFWACACCWASPHPPKPSHCNLVHTYRHTLPSHFQFNHHTLSIFWG